MDLIEWLFGSQKGEKEEKATKIEIVEEKKQERKYTKENIRIDREKGYAVQIKKTEDLSKDKSTEDLPEVAEEIRDKN